MPPPPFPAPPAADEAGAPRPLTLRQERFCHAFVLNPNAARAARAAGYEKGSARKQGWRLLRSLRIRARLREIQTELALDQNDSIDALIGKLEVVYRQAVQDRRTLAAVRAVELQGRFTQLKRRLPPAAEEAAAAIRAAVEQRRAAGRAGGLATARARAALALEGDNRRRDVRDFLDAEASDGAAAP